MARSPGFRGARTTLLGQFAKFLIQVTALVVLARLLTPQDYGLYGMVLVFTGFGALLGDFGLSAASIQAREITSQQRANLFWVNISFGIATMLVFVLLAGPVSSLYGEDELAAVIVAVSAMFVVQGASAQFAANVTRDLRFGVLAWSEVLSQFIGLVVAIVLATLGFGVWALASQQIAVAVVVLLVLVLATKWRPGMPRRAPMKSLFIYGANTFGVQVLNFATAKVDSFVIGLALGPSALGMYDRGYQINQIPTQQLATPLTRVALPLLARHQDDLPRVNSDLAVIARALGYLLGGAIILVGANSAAVVHIVLGEQWAPVSMILAILAVGGFFQAMGYVYYWAFLALGQTGVQLRFALVTRPVMVVLIVAGSFFGLEGVAVGVSAGLLLNWAVLTFVAIPRIRLSPRVLVAPMMRAFVLWVVGAGGAAVLVRSWSGGTLPIVVELLASVVCALLFASVFVLLPPYRRDFRAMKSILERPSE